MHEVSWQEVEEATGQAGPRGMARLGELFRLLLGLLVVLLLRQGADPGPQPAAPPATAMTMPAALRGSDDLAPHAGMDPESWPSGLRLNEIQVLGTHNSYHVAPWLPLPPWRYSMAPLERQLDGGVRQIELDLHRSPGGGFSVHHLPLFDTRSTCRSFAGCLEQIRGWSERRPGHLPLFVLLELKDEVDGAKFFNAFDAIQRQLLAVWPREQILAPEDVRGPFATMGEALRRRGWPMLDECRGKVIFVLLNRGWHQRVYAKHRRMDGDPLLFTMERPENPDAAFVELDHPLRHLAKIRAAVRRGLIVRTRADVDGVEARANDRRRGAAALASGAQIISTDFPRPARPGRYGFQLPGGWPWRVSPATPPDGWFAPSRNAGLPHLPAWHS